MSRTRGLTLVEVLIVVMIIGILIGLLLPAICYQGPAVVTKDQVQIKQIHAAWTTFCRDYDGVLPIPGRLPGDPGPGGPIANTSAALYSACIMLNYFTPQILVSPAEPSGVVAVKDDYDWSLFSPVDGVCWDATIDGAAPPNARPGYVPFAVNLRTDNPHTGAPVCNASYAHNPLCGERLEREWRDTLNSRWAVLGNRGVICGEDRDRSVYEASVTLGFHGSRDRWVGNIGFNDNHVELHDTFYPEGLTFLDASGAARPDNLFRNDARDGDCNSGLGLDVFLTLVSAVADEESCVITTEWD